MNAPLYTIEILRLAASLAEPRELDRIDGSAEVRSPTCGSRIATTLSVGPDGKVDALSQQVHACAFGQASASILQQGAVGSGRAEVEAALAQLDSWLSGSEVVPDWPNIAALAPARSRNSRHGAILLPFRALLAAMDRATRG